MGYQITLTVGYGLQACIELAKSDGMLPASSIAGKADVSTSYMGQVLNRLRTGRILTSTGGVHGGYRLSRAASFITVGQIIQSIEGPSQSMPENIPLKVRRQLKQACRELHAIRLSDL